MPHADEPPDSVARLSRRQALEFSATRFPSESDRLLKVLDRTLAELRTEPDDGPSAQVPPGNAAMPSAEHPKVVHVLDLVLEGECSGVQPRRRTAGHRLWDGTARVWDLASGRQQAMVKHDGHSEPVVSVAFSPDGRLLATASHDRTAKLWALVQ